jgi:hypothetical protein
MQIKEELLDIPGIKKSNKPLIDLFIRRTAVLTSTPEAIVEKIIKDQWRHANKMTQPEFPIAEIDFCNLGTFYISNNKAQRRLLKIERVQALNAKQDPATKKVNERKEIIEKHNENIVKTIKLKIKQNEN